MQLKAPTAPGGGHLDRSPASGQVVTYSPDENHFCCEHERATRAEMARRLARLKGLRFGGDWQRDGEIVPGTYYVPGDTLSANSRRAVSASAAATTCSAAWCRSPSSPPRRSRIRWSAQRRARRSAGTIDFARGSQARCTTAGPRSAPTMRCWPASGCLHDGAARVKAVRATGGRGQWVVNDRDALRALHRRDRPV